MATRCRQIARRAFLPVLAGVAIAALFGASLAFNRLGELNAQRDRDRVATDVAACERGNAFRAQTKDVGTATDRLVTSILDIIFTNPEQDRSAALERLRRRLDVPIAEFRDAVAALKQVDCQRAIPGATR